MVIRWHLNGRVNRHLSLLKLDFGLKHMLQKVVLENKSRGEDREDEEEDTTR